MSWWKPLLKWIGKKVIDVAADELSKKATPKKPQSRKPYTH